MSSSPESSLLFTVPELRSEVSQYIIRVIFSDWWGIDVEFRTHYSEEYIIEYQKKNDSKKCILPCIFLVKEDAAWLEKRSVGFWNLNFDPNGKQSVNLSGGVSNEKWYFKEDYFGMIFFFLNRYHELTEKLSLDKHGRYIEENSLIVRSEAIQYQLVERLLLELGEKIEADLGIAVYKKAKFDILPSHDVDRPFEFYYYTFFKLLKRGVGDVFIRKSLSELKKRLRLYSKVKAGKVELDPYNSFSWIMDQSEKYSRTSVFHFITENTNVDFDQDYQLSDSVIELLFSRIFERGHFVGLHPSYGATVIKNQVKKERQILSSQLQKLGIERSIIKSRNHYLRWNEDYIDELENAEINVDQTLGFARQPGFRCGTARDFHPFNFNENRASTVKYEPLVLMEATLIGVNYLNLGKHLEDAWDIVESLKKECKNFGGNFTVLWHNNNFYSEELREFYKECIK